MVADPATWRCPVCEGVNHGGRICTTCGEQLPDGYVPVDAADRPAGKLATAPRTRPEVVSAPGAPRTPSPEEIFGSNPFRG